MLANFIDLLPFDESPLVKRAERYYYCSGATPLLYRIFRLLLLSSIDVRNLNT